MSLTPATPSIPDTTLVLLNPHARGGQAAAWQTPLQTWLAEHGSPLQVHAPDTPDEALALLMRQPRGSRVVLAGGDGSLQQWLPALLAQQLEFGLVPLGSGNDVARALGVHLLEPRQALARALTGEARPIDLGQVRWERPPLGGRLVQTEVHDRPFISSLAAGFDAAVALRALQVPRRLSGRARYLWAILGEIRRLQAWPVQVFVDQERVYQGPCLLASALNTPSYGSGIPACPGNRCDDGQLQMLLGERFGRLGVLRLLPRLLKGHHTQQRGVRVGSLQRMWVHSQVPMPIAVDGEYLGLAQQYRVQVLPGALRAVRGPDAATAPDSPR